MKFRGKQCPKCGKKGLKYADHGHVQGGNNLSIVHCRYCKVDFKAEKIEKYFDWLDLLIID